MWCISIAELRAFILVLYIRGVQRGKNISVKEISNKKWGITFIRECIPRWKFLQITKYINFDTRSTTSERLKTDKFALISNTLGRFENTNITRYNPGENITIDEQLFPSKARSPFTQYIANKPDKFGIQFWIAVDADAKYFLNGYSYIGSYATRPANIPSGMLYYE